jgi:hypothetical protein
VDSCRRHAPDALNIHLELAPWADVLAERGVKPTELDESQLCVSIDTGSCIIAPLDTISAHWGPRAAKVVFTALRRGLGRVINVWDPDDLEWFAEYWLETLDFYTDDAASREFVIGKIEEFGVSATHVNDSFLPVGADLRTALKSLPSGPIRRSAAALLSQARTARALFPDPSLQRMQATQGYPSAAVLLTKGPDDAVRHAYDEVQENAMNSGESTGPHAVVLLDTSCQDRLAADVQQLHRVLRTLAWGERLVWEIKELSS